MSDKADNSQEVTATMTALGFEWHTDYVAEGVDYGDWVHPELEEPVNQDAAAFFHQAMQRREVEAEVAGMERARQIVLRRTEIPRDAKNPTRDAVVVLGEEIADLIKNEAALRSGQEGE